VTQYTYGLTQALGHGHAFSQNLAVPDPAAGSGFTYTNQLAYWELPDSLSFVLTTSDVDADRAVSLVIADGSGISLATVPTNDTTAASQTAAYSFVWNFSASLGTTNGPFLSVMPRVFLQPTFTLTVSVTNIDTGDQISDIRLEMERFVTGPSGYLLGVVDSADTPAAGLVRDAAILS
jgi:hypothetical protein